MTDAQIKHMAGRFLSWKLPETFSPDGGISFKPTFNEHTPHPMRHEPSGTNLLDAAQAEAMVRHMLEGLPPVSDVEPTISAIMEQAQVFASTYSLVGGRFDDGSKMAQSEDEKTELEQMIRAALKSEAE